MSVIHSAGVLQVDLIVCFDALGSPVRMVQRMGRTGRKRHGRVRSPSKDCQCVIGGWVLCTPEHTPVVVVTPPLQVITLVSEGAEVNKLKKSHQSALVLSS